MFNTSGTEILIREALDSDIPALSELMNELGYPTTETDMHLRFNDIQRHDDYKMYVATVNLIPVGMIGLVKNHFFERNGTCIRVGALVVMKEFQKKGIGKELMKKAEEWAKESGSTSILLNSGNREQRKDAHQFYISLGYQVKTSGFVKDL